MTATTVPRGRELPCGCKRGVFLCPEAERLWARVTEAYRVAGRKPGHDNSWNAYDERREEYRRHVEPETAEEK